ncbi:NUDIX domain-containing protein [Candidatus Daviesbacteria bacterium]|nr:NUDIX domain-containing protein [Candidatus Daviesbacteria bacterium]
MKDQVILGVDEQGNFSGEYFSKEAGHSGNGKKHLAITVLLQNNNSEVLLQKRKHQVFDNIWDMTASTHPLHKEDGSDETNTEATVRALKDEYGIEKVEDLKEVGSIDYFTKYGKFCENEHDIILTAKYAGEINLNLETAYEFKWVNKQDFLEDIENNSEKFSPWAIEGAKLLKKSNFFV